MSHLTKNEINTLENKAFRLECEVFMWRKFRKEVEDFLTMQSTFGSNTPEEIENLKKELESIKYY